MLNIKINREILLDGLTTINLITSGKGALAILSSILISTKGDNKIEISATNLETNFCGIYPAKIIDSGQITFPCKELITLISKLKSEEICITEKENCGVDISGDSTIFSTTFLLVDDFPIIPENMWCKKEIEIDPLVFKNMIAKAVVIRPQDEVSEKRSHISGALFKVIKKDKQDFLQMASTNGGVLVEVNEEILIEKEAGKTMEEGVLISKKELLKLNNSLLKNIKKKPALKNKGFKSFEQISEQTISFTVKGDFFIAQKQNETIAIRLLEGVFPHYRDIINREDNNFIKVNRKILLDGMKQITAMESKYDCITEVSIETNILKMTFTNQYLGKLQKNIPIDYNGVAIEARYKASQFVSFLNLMQSDIVTLNINDNISPCLLTGEQDNGVVFVIMPWKE